jgi:hypothetical protein
MHVFRGLLLLLTSLTHEYVELLVSAVTLLRSLPFTHAVRFDKEERQNLDRCVHNLAQ